MTTLNTEHTIVARGTPAGRGGIAVIRVSGSLVPDIARALLGRLPEPRYATLAEFLDAEGRAIDTGLALYFPGPHSFTGEDVLELHGHGGTVVCGMLIERVCSLGARVAEAGEFSRRAFLNDKLDLAQAEAIADLIDSSSQTAARAAQRSMQGRFSDIVLQLNDQVTELRVYVEAAMDFPEEEIDFLSDEALLNRLDSVRERFDEVENTVTQGRLLRDGATVVLAGRPNAGKSSLLNVLAGYDAAIVTEIEGTTRDVIREHIELNGLPLNVIDTAGLRVAGDLIEEEGVRRAQRELGTADHALVVIDAGGSDLPEELLEELPSDLSCTIVRNKIDLTGEPAGVSTEEDNTVAVSALTGAGIEELRAYLEKQLGYEPAGEGSVTARRRHLESLRRAREHFDAAAALLAQAELMAEELLQVQNALAEITGQFSSDDLLGEIFTSFCIGK